MAMSALHSICNAKDKRRDRDESEDGRHHNDERFVSLLQHNGGLSRHAPRNADGSKGRQRDLAWVYATEFEIRLGTEHGYPIAMYKPVVSTRALGHLAPIARHNRHWSQVAKMSAKRRMDYLRIRHLHLDHCEPHPSKLDVVRISS
jgi:hypothetical protein